MEAADLADAIVSMVTRPRRMAVNEILFRRTEQIR
jgi:NADP-dependent 3-hydroxy acid dehydrogenase YdfG